MERMKVSKFKSCAVALIFAACGLAGCEKMVEFDVEEVTPKVVIVSRPDADSTVQVRLTYSRFFLDNHAFRTITDADVRLFANGMQISPDSAGDGNYYFNCRPQPGDSMALQVLAPGHDLVEAGTIVPSAPDFEVLEALYDSLTRTCHVKVRINDPKGSNYYQVSFEMWTVRHNNGNADDTVLVPIWISSEDMVFTDATSLDYMLDGGQTYVSGRKLSFSDALFDGKAYTMEFEVWEMFMDMGAGILDPVFPIQVQLTALTRDRYQYDRTLKQSYEQEDFLSEPIQIFTNVKGGIGIFASATAKKIPVKLSIK